jgi:HEAT repeat protein
LWTTDRSSQVGIVTTTISTLKEAKLSPSQQASFAGAALPLLKTNDPIYNDGDIQEYACKVFIKYPDRRAVPQLHALLSSSHPWVRRDAARALAASGEDVPIPARPTTW